MRITIKKEVFQKFHPQFKVAFILAENINPKLSLPESRHLLQEVEDMVHLLFQKENPKTHHLLSPWAVLQQAAGGKHYQTSLEKLLTKVIQKKKIPTPSPFINLLNYLSLKHLVPLTLDDFHKIKGNLTFQLSTGQERASLLKKLPKNELYYRDEKHILGTKLDFWKSPYTQPDKKTTAYLIHLEALPPITDKKLREILREAVNLIKTFCQGKTKTFILDKKKTSVKIQEKP